jgi:methylated-DNA-[protein]-cysteine S-methyltransferase
MKRAPYATPFGTGWVTFDGGTVVELRLPGSPPPEMEQATRRPVPIAELVASLERYFAGNGPLPAPTDEIERAGTTPWQRAVYRVVAAIPAGTTMSYSEVAAAAGRPGAARAVGSAMARNPFAPIIPCHRVVGSDGSLGGYGGGLAMKSALLEMEGLRDA